MEDERKRKSNRKFLCKDLEIRAEFNRKPREVTKYRSYVSIFTAVIYDIKEEQHILSN